ncbi:MAG TPA: hypothetical protein VH164_15380 [Ktedonobacteraceae bacterium]|nr:hypothetical protein [Ktedonobacteraceae bacterium]
MDRPGVLHAFLGKDFDGVFDCAIINTAALVHLLCGMSSPNEDARECGVYVLLLFLLSVPGLLAALIVYHNGHSLGLWWVYGATVFIVAFLRALRPSSKNSSTDKSVQQSGKDCPYCLERVPLEDEICPACHLRLYDPVLDGPPVGHPMTQQHA